MCGIAGWYRDDRLAEGRDPLDRMVQRLVHRGPDEAGYFRSPGIALGMRRLAVIDPTGSQQPCRNEDGNVIAVCNGEIYNFRELRTLLEYRGHRFRTRGDVETIVHLYEDYGLDFVHHLRGMFAVALWDRQAHRLVLARDRLGIKPLHYGRVGTELLFASELTALRAGLPGSSGLDLTALAQYLAFGYILAPRTIYQNISKLPAGHILVAEDGRVAIRQYWDVPLDEVRDVSFDEAARRLHDLLRDAVASHLVSDVPLGALLSGGIDSSAIVALVAELATGPVETFSVGFDRPEYDELRFARVVAQRLGTQHHEFSTSPHLVDLLPTVVTHHGEPFADPSSLPTSVVSELARTRVTVALSGDGGDELFAGYTRYAVDRQRRWAEWIPLPLRRHTFGALADRLGPGAYGVNLLRTLASDRQARYLSSISSPLDPHIGGLAAREYFASLRWEDVAGPFLDAFDRARSRDFTTRLMYVDLKTYLPDDILTKVDRMSMAHSLEVRPPFLDHRVVEFAMRLPVRYKLAWSRSKRVLLRALHGRLPAECWQRPKQGFALPLAPWFKAALRDRLHAVAHYHGRLGRLLNPAGVQRLAHEHLTGRRDHADVLWKLLVLEEWDRWSRADTGASPPARSHGARLPV